MQKLTDEGDELAFEGRDRGEGGRVEPVDRLHRADRRGRQLVKGDVVMLAGQAARVADEGADDGLPW